MFRQFWKDRSGQFAMMTAVAMVPLLGGLALAIDYGEITRQRQETLNALDAAGVATGRQMMFKKTVTDAEKTLMKEYAKDFFEANLRTVKPANTTLTVLLPQDNNGGGTLKLTAGLKYAPIFYPAFARLLGQDPSLANTKVDFSAISEIRLKNTLEVALVLDNSGSMNFEGGGSGEKRIDLLKKAAKELVDSLSNQAALMKAVPKPVQMSVVPFASSVNVGPANKDAAWMDTKGLSPIHYENFTWTNAVATNKGFTTTNGKPYKSNGSAWPAAERNTLVTRFTLFNELKRVSGSSSVAVPGRDWAGCVETRPAPYNMTDEPASESTPKTLFVPMFAPDEAGNMTTLNSSNTPTFKAYNDWWGDGNATTSTATTSAALRQKNIAKYFIPNANSNFTLSTYADSGSPNASCTTKPITPLVDISVQAGVDSIKASIDAMGPLGATNVPDGMAWGWRTLSKGAPFTEGRDDGEQSNDKVVIVLTDGANTYYTPTSFTDWWGNPYYEDHAGNKSTYSAYGYTSVVNTGETYTRLYRNTGTDVVKTTYSNENYTLAMNQHFGGVNGVGGVCNNAKTAGIIVITVSLDLDATKPAEKGQIDMLKECASFSRFTKDPADPTKFKKLYYEATGGTLSEKFNEISNELSNLRIVG